VTYHILAPLGPHVGLRNGRILESLHAHLHGTLQEWAVGPTKTLKKKDHT